MFSVRVQLVNQMRRDLYLAAIEVILPPLTFKIIAYDRSNFTVLLQVADLLTDFFISP